jgi:hypothetical protein
MFSGTPLSTLTSLSNSYIQINTAVAPYNSGNVLVYLAPTNTGVTVNIKDIGGSTSYFYDNSYSIIVSTVTGGFSDGTSSKSISIPYGSMTLTTSQSNIWAPVYNQVLTSSLIQTVSSLYISTNATAYNYTNVASTTVYGNISTTGNIEVTGTLMLGNFSTFTVPTMSNTFYTLATTSSYVSSLTFLSVMSNLGSLPDPYISTTTLDKVYKNLGTTFNYISTAQMVKDIGILSTLFISSLQQLNPQLVHISSLIYNNNGVKATNPAITINKGYGVSSFAILPLYLFDILVTDIMFAPDGRSYLLTPTQLYRYDYTVPSTTKVDITGILAFTNATAMRIVVNGSNYDIYICDSPSILKIQYSGGSNYSYSLFATVTGILSPAIYSDSTYIYVYVKPDAQSIGSLYKYTITTSASELIGKFLNSNDICTGIGVVGDYIYISSQLQIFIYLLADNSILWYTFNGKLLDGPLTITRFDREPYYIDTPCRTQHIKSMKYYNISGGTLFFTDVNKIRTLSATPVPIYNAGVVSSNISGYYVTTVASTTVDYTNGGPFDSNQTGTGDLSSIYTFDNMNQIFYKRNTGIQITGLISLGTMTPARKPIIIVDMVFDNLGFLYILTPYTLLKYSFITNVFSNNYRIFSFSNAINMAYDGGVYLYITDSLDIPPYTTNIWSINLVSLIRRSVYSTTTQIVASFFYMPLIYYFTSTNLLGCVNITTGLSITPPSITAPASVISLVVTSTNFFVSDTTGLISIYNSTGTLVNSTRIGNGTIDGYFGGSSASYVFSRSYTLKIDPSGSIYFTDTNTVRKLVYNSTTNRGQVVTVAGTGTLGTDDGDGDTATLKIVRGDTLTFNNGILYISNNSDTTTLTTPLRRIIPLTGNDRLSATFVSTATTVVSGYTVSNYIGLNVGMYTASDIKIKESVKPLTSSIEKISRLQGIQYTKIDEEKPRFGCIAQDVEIEYPEVIENRTDGIKGIYYDNLTAPLVECVKELTRRVKWMESRVSR